MFDYNDLKSLMANNKYPCYIRDIASEKIIHANDEFFKVFHCDQDIYLKKFKEVVNLDHSSYINIQDSITKQENFEFVFYHDESNQNYSGSATIIGNGTAIFCEYKIFADGEHENAFEKAMTQCMDIYQQPKDTLVSFMKLLCDFYQSERAYVYRFKKEDTTFHCIEQWSADPNYRVIEEVGQSKNASFLIHWIKTEHNSGLVTADSESEDFPQDSPLAQVLSNFKMRNLTLCVIEDVNQELIGVVGLSNRKSMKTFFDRRLIHTIAWFVAQNVSKAVIDETLFRVHHRDILTGLYNRVGYSRRVGTLRETPPKTLGVISVNINGLKYINEHYGNSSGDDFIKNTAVQLKNYFKFEFFRMGGDEFIGLAPEIGEDIFLTKVNVLHTTMKKDNNMDFSFGHAWSSGSYSLSKLLQEAETIMYINKQEYYHTSERTFDSVRDSVLSDLLSYLENDEFMIYLQPQVHLEDGSLYGAEALIRRFDKMNQKMVFPDQFIPLYEQKSVIRHVDLFVVKAVCTLLVQWVNEGKAIPISVNLSRVTLQEFGIVDTIVEICDRYQVPHKLLVIEVTERVGLVENNVASSLIQQFKDNGFLISLDDFGCAYSNIVTLAQIEVDEVKIDKSLVDNITTSKKNLILVKNVLSMCNELDGASTLAEGIEEEAQAKLLHDLGCHLGQGYFYSRPISVKDFQAIYL